MIISQSNDILNLVYFTSIFFLKVPISFLPFPQKIQSFLFQNFCSLVFKIFNLLSSLSMFSLEQEKLVDKLIIY